MRKRRHLPPTAELLKSFEVQLMLARRRVRRGHAWTTTGYRESQGYGDCFLASHGLLADEHVSDDALRIAWDELNEGLAFATYDSAA